VGLEEHAKEHVMVPVEETVQVPMDERVLPPLPQLDQLVSSEARQLVPEPSPFTLTPTLARREEPVAPVPHAPYCHRNM
jgi:hypothetical protein